MARRCTPLHAARRRAGSDARAVGRRPVACEVDPVLKALAFNRLKPPRFQAFGFKRRPAPLHRGEVRAGAGERQGEAGDLGRGERGVLDAELLGGAGPGALARVR